MKESKKVQIIKSEDGSHTLFNPELNETYHSIHGAKTESLHVFIQNGLRLISTKNPVILEIGMGTGLNVLLTRQYQLANKNIGAIHYHTIEFYPLKVETIQKLNYTKELADKDSEFFSAIHNAEWNNTSQIDENFLFHKIRKDLLEFSPDFRYDIIYFDAFAPDIQPALWNKKILQRLYEQLNAGGVFTTYSAKGQLRRDLIEIGFRVERRTGPPGKREMLVAYKEVKKVYP